MRIREKYAITDRLKLFFVLLFVLLLLAGVAKLKAEKETQSATIEKLLTTALEPVGSTMYIWGGGWNDEDEAAGSTATQLGLRPEWKKFADKQNTDYDFKQYRFEREKGLDCSGYVGWVLYNTFERQNGESGYVTTSTDFAESLAERGWGTLISNPEEFLPGDIVSMQGHVWICLGTCEDGSVLLVHSSPPGVSVCGTPSTENVQKSCAVLLAEAYMKANHPNWQEKYPNRQVGENYLKEGVVFRWSEEKMEDANELQGLGAETVLERITGEKEIP